MNGFLAMRLLFLMDKLTSENHSFEYQVFELPLQFDLYHIE
jgi:hypothetical protein